MERFIVLKNKISICLFLFLSITIFGQENTDVKKYIKKYPNSDFIRLINESEIDIYLENDKIKIREVTTKEDLYLNESAFQYSKESVSYSSFFELENITAYSSEFIKGKYIKHEISDFKKKDELDGSFYDDVKSVNFRYSNLKKAGKTKLITTEIVKDPRFLSSFYFGGFFPIKKSKLTITVDKRIAIEFKEFNMLGLDYTFKKKEKRNKITYTWTAENIQNIEMEPRTPNFRNYYPHLVPRIKSYQINDKQPIKLLGNVTDLYNWYYSMVKDINTSPVDQELVNIVNELIKDQETEQEKVRAIYYWVQDQIKYIANEYALGGFIPREANDVFIKKYGDCKDNSSILYTMLKTAGIEGNLTWIGTRDVPYLYEEMPTPAVDNHMILTYENKDSIYYLDATGRYLPLGYPSSFIQGKEALIGKGEDGYKISKVPVLKPEKTQEIDSCFVRLEDGNLVGNGLMEFTGYAKVNLFAKLESMTKKETRDYYTHKLRKGSNRFLLQDYKEYNKYSYDKSFKVDYHFTHANYAIFSDDELYINLNLNKLLSRVGFSESRKTDFEITNKKMSRYITVFEIPKGYIVDYMPENLNIDLGFASGYITFKQEGNKIIYEQKVRVNFLTLPISQHADYLKMSKEFNKTYKEVIVLIKIK